MPKEKVCKEFEKLIHKVHDLLDARKVSEKIEGEIRVLEAARDERRKKDQEANPDNEKTIKVESEDHPGVSSSGDLPSNNNNNEGEENDNAEREGQDNNAVGVDGDGDVDAEAENAGANQEKQGSSSNKRSASVLSAVSDKSSKRQRK
jgi:DNA methyltransferase 1-associated protein 1